MVEARMLKIEQARMLKIKQTRMSEEVQVAKNCKIEAELSEEVQVAKSCKIEACQNDTKGLFHNSAVTFWFTFSKGMLTGKFFYRFPFFCS